MQFDDVLNTGLYVTNDIHALGSEGGSTVAQRLPTSALSAEAWFTAEEEEISLAGLVGVKQESPGCALGWSLTFDRKKTIPIIESDKKGQSESTYVFKVALQRDSSTTAAPPSFVELRHTAPLHLFVWTHVVAAYNRSHLLLFVNGREAAVQEACADYPCGNIVYSYSQHEGSLSCAPGQTALTVGTVHGSMQDALKGYKYPHQGLLKHVRILSTAVSAPGVEMLYGIFAAQMKLVAPSPFEYWVKARSLPGPHTTSPSIDAVHAEAQDWITSLGNFSTAQQYRCKFTYGSQTQWSPANTSCSSGHFGTGGCHGQHVDQLTCLTPRWRIGFRAVTFSIDKKLSAAPPMSFATLRCLKRYPLPISMLSRIFAKFVRYCINGLGVPFAASMCEKRLRLRTSLGTYSGQPFLVYSRRPQLAQPRVGRGFDTYWNANSGCHVQSVKGQSETHTGVDLCDGWGGCVGNARAKQICSSGRFSIHAHHSGRRALCLRCHGLGWQVAQLNFRSISLQ